MKHLTCLAAIAAATLAVAAPAAAQTRYDRQGQGQDEEARFDAAQRRFDAEYQAYRAATDRYRQFRNQRTEYGPPRGPAYYDERDEGDYDAARYYRSGPTYQERVLGPDERVYRGEDGRYYCRRNDGTTGLIVGGAAGGLFGNAISSRHSRTVGTLLGAVAGAALGSAVDRNNQQVSCR